MLNKMLLYIISMSVIVTYKIMDGLIYHTRYPIEEIPPQFDNNEFGHKVVDEKYTQYTHAIKIINDTIVEDTTEIDKVHSFKMAQFRNKRNDLLGASDKYLMPDFPNLDNVKRNYILGYRMLLRDITQYNNPDMDFPVLNL
jgi:hypothetical protein